MVLDGKMAVMKEKDRKGGVGGSVCRPWMCGKGGDGPEGGDGEG